MKKVNFKQIVCQRHPTPPLPDNLRLWQRKKVVSKSIKAVKYDVWSGTLTQHTKGRRRRHRRIFRVSRIPNVSPGEVPRKKLKSSFVSRWFRICADGKSTLLSLSPPLSDSIQEKTRKPYRCDQTAESVVVYFFIHLRCFTFFQFFSTTATHFVANFLLIDDEGKGF